MLTSRFISVWSHHTRKGLTQKKIHSRINSFEENITFILQEKKGSGTFLCVIHVKTF